MPARRGIFLTGATGFLGRYLLRSLTAAGHRIAVLARPSPDRTAAERVAELVAAWGDALRTKLLAPVVLEGDVRSSRLGLDRADRRCLSLHCDAVVHAAASVSFQPSADGEPWASNVTGTRHLLELCTSLSLVELHHLSTAFVCGQHPGPVHEDELGHGQAFHNDYEQSKWEAERLVRQAAGIRATVYRPSVLVGDSRTGYTSSYQGLYRFLELATRLAQPRGPGRLFLPLRLPFTGDEPHNLVPIDWAAEALVRILSRPERHGRTYHLVSPRPVRMNDVKAVAEEVLRLEGVEWAGRDGVADPSPLEQLFQDGLRQYWPYLDGDPDFDWSNTRAALPDLAAPPLDRPLLARLIRFAVRDDWGRAGRRRDAAGPAVDCRAYVESFFPAHAGLSTLARVITLDLTVGLEVRGPGGGQWTCRWAGGELLGISRCLPERAGIVYRLDAGTFAAIVRGRQTPQDAFFARQIAIEGDVEKALKLALLFGQFVKEFPYPPARTREAVDASASR
jgi:thioester reductase-like protein